MNKSDSSGQSTPYENITVEVPAQGVGLITLARPAALNALSRALRLELSDAIAAMEADPLIRALIVTGMGEKAFSAGADIHEISSNTAEEMKLRYTEASSFLLRLANLSVPTIAAVNGVAYGGGAYLASAFDIRYGCENTQFRFLGAQYGQINSTWTLPQIVGWPKAKELIFSGRMVEAEEAEAMGLLNRVVPASLLLDSVVALASQIAGNVPQCVELSKRLLNAGMGCTLLEMQQQEEAVVVKELVLEPVAKSFAGFLSRKPKKGQLT